jgi:hypothetical protein
MKPPLSRIGVLTPAELDGLITNSEIKAKYSEVVDRESAYELLNKKIENATVEAGEATATSSSAEKEEEGGGFFDAIGDAINSPVGKMITKEVTRGLLGVLGLKGTTTRRRTGLFG